MQQKIHPKVSNNQKRRKRIELLVSEDEIELLKKYSQQANLSLSAYLREKGLRHQVGRRFDTEIMSKVIATFLKCHASWSKVGNNINQIAKTTHQKKGEVPPEIIDIKKKLDELFSKSIALQELAAEKLGESNKKEVLHVS